MLDWIVPLTDVVVALLLMLLGGNLGSFLNVVVHRLPRGESVVTGGSRCPACGSAIRWHDNVPVLGWLLLRGRCRDCGGEIAARYPLVEAAAALVLGGVASVELLSGGATFPGGVLVGGRSGADNLLLRPDPGLLGVALFHAWVLFNLLLGAAITIDGTRVPQAWSTVVLGLTVAAVTAWSWLIPVGLLGEPWPRGAFGAGPARGVIVSVVGLLCGAILAGGLFGNRRPEALRRGLALVGAALGWQGVVGVALFTMLTGWCRHCLAELFPRAPADDASVVVAESVPVAEGAPMTVVADGETALPAERPTETPPGPARVSTWRRLGIAAGGGIAHPGWDTGDLVVGTAVFLLLWSTCVGFWPWKT